MTRTRILTLTMALALAVAACGGASDDGAIADETPTVATGDELPTNPAAGACLAGDPNCLDVPGNDAPPLLEGDEPDLSADPNSGSSGFIVDGGVTISDALEGGLEGVIAVKGFVVADDSGARLCELLAESLPPQCGGATIELSNLSTVDPDELRTDQGVTWSEQSVTLLGELVDGTLVVDALSS